MFVNVLFSCPPHPGAPYLQLTALQAKVHYLRYLSELRLYGGREFQSVLLVRDSRFLLLPNRCSVLHFFFLLEP